MSDLDCYIIGFCQGDKSRLRIVCIEQCNMYELDECDRASRHLFYDAQDLAEKHNLRLSSADPTVEKLLQSPDGFLN